MTLRFPNLRTLTAILLLAASPALAQQTPPPAEQPAMPGMAAGASPADRAMMESMAAMHRDMEHAPMTGDPDHDFAAMMIPHHQGAVAMAKLELRYGKDPELRRLARAIVAAQHREIGQMRRWLAAHPGH